MKIDRYHFPIVDSTNVWAKANVRYFKRDRITVVTAGEQTAGRGRHNRVWISPPDQNLYATFCLFLPPRRRDFANVTQVVAVSAALELSRMGYSPSLKWPNDILIENAKVGGILGETTRIDDEVCCLIGLGLNINMPPSALASLDRPATSLSIIAKQSLNLEEISDQISNAVCAGLKRFLKDGLPPFLENFRGLLVHQLGDTVRFHLGNVIVEGSFHSINDDGTLNLIINDDVKRIVSGEIA
ncbi:MAG: biotin--[acetyl-CoA-carboxylase] ligase [Chlamydiales bacterium]|nr:biotin--[acetyl-CoA-carboxylase] ligase [Chlamydiales bacterium]